MSFFCFFHIWGVGQTQIWINPYIFYFFLNPSLMINIYCFDYYFSNLTPTFLTQKFQERTKEKEKFLYQSKPKKSQHKCTRKLFKPCGYSAGGKIIDFYGIPKKLHNEGQIRTKGNQTGNGKNKIQSGKDREDDCIGVGFIIIYIVTLRNNN